MNNELFHQVAASITDSYWTILLAKLWGQGYVWTEYDYSITCYRYKGITYVTDFKKV